MSKYVKYILLTCIIFGCDEKKSDAQKNSALDIVDKKEITQCYTAYKILDTKDNVVCYVLDSCGSRSGGISCVEVKHEKSSN